MYIFLAALLAMLAAGALAIVLLGYLLGVYDKYRARKNADGHPGHAPLPSI